MISISSETSSQKHIFHLCPMISKHKAGIFSLESRKYLEPCWAWQEAEASQGLVQSLQLLPSLLSSNQTLIDPIQACLLRLPKGVERDASIKSAFQLVNENIVAGVFSSTKLNTIKKTSTPSPVDWYKTTVTSFGQMKRCGITELCFSMGNSGYNGRNNIVSELCPRFL